MSPVENIQSNSVNPDLSEAERIASVPLPEVKLNFQTVTGDDIRQSRPIRWQTETAKRKTWADKYAPSESKQLLNEIQQTSTSKQKSFMDYVSDFIRP